MTGRTLPFVKEEFLAPELGLRCLFRVQFAIDIQLGSGGPGQDRLWRSMAGGVDVRCWAQARGPAC